MSRTGTSFPFKSFHNVQQQVYHLSTLEIFKIKGWQNDLSVCVLYMYTKHKTTWKVLCTVFKHEFVFESPRHVNKSCLNTVRSYFPCTILHDCKFLLVSCNLVWSLVRASTLFQETFLFFFYRLPSLNNSVESQSNFNLQVSLVSFCDG